MANTKTMRQQARIGGWKVTPWWLASAKPARRKGEPKKWPPPKK